MKKKRRHSKYIDRRLAVKCADKAMSAYIRERDNWKCITCGKIAKGQAMHAGHFIPRGYWIWRFDERNAHAQCATCNKYLSGNWPAYYVEMVEKYGQEFVNELIRDKHRPANYTVPDLNEIEEAYKRKLAALREKRGR